MAVEDTGLLKLEVDTKGAIANVEALDKRVDEILAGLGEFGPELASAADQAAGALAELGEKSERGLDGGQAAAVRARVALDAYRSAIEKARDAGATIADEQVIELRILEREYADQVEKLGELKRAQQDVGRAISQTSAEAGGAIPRMNDLGDVFEQVGGKAGAMGLKILSAYAALRTGVDIGNDVRKGLDAIFGAGTTDGIVRSTGAFQALKFAIDKLTGAEDSAAVAAERLRNEQNILRNRGLDPTGMSAAEVAAKVEELGKQTQAAAIASAQAKNEAKDAAEAQDRLADRQERAADTARRHAAAQREQAAAIRESAAAADQGPARDVFGRELDPAAAQQTVDALRKRQAALEKEAETGIASAKTFEQLAEVKSQLFHAEAKLTEALRAQRPALDEAGKAAHGYEVAIQGAAGGLAQLHPEFEKLDANVQRNTGSMDAAREAVAGLETEVRRQAETARDGVTVVGKLGASTLEYEQNAAKARDAVAGLAAGQEDFNRRGQAMAEALAKSAEGAGDLGQQAKSAEQRIADLEATVAKLVDTEKRAFDPDVVEAWAVKVETRAVPAAEALKACLSSFGG